jgi:hypothetical protein
MYGMLFASAWQTVKTLGYDYKLLGAETGMVALLHTWGQSLVLHPHLHCSVPGGGLDYKNQWKKAKSNGKYLFPRDVIKVVYKGSSLKTSGVFLNKKTSGWHTWNGRQSLKRNGWYMQKHPF